MIIIPSSLLVGNCRMDPGELQFPMESGGVAADGRNRKWKEMDETTRKYRKYTENMTTMQQWRLPLYSTTDTSAFSCFNKLIRILLGDALDAADLAVVEDDTKELICTPYQLWAEGSDDELCML